MPGEAKVYEGLLRRVNERSDVHSLRIGPDDGTTMPELD